MEILASIAKKELYMGYIFGIMILGGYIRQYHVLDDVYSLAKRYIKDNRIMIIITSLLGGVLPIPCLLYTSPSPRDDCPSRMPSSA